MTYTKILASAIVIIFSIIFSIHLYVDVQQYNREQPTDRTTAKLMALRNDTLPQNSSEINIQQEFRCSEVPDLVKNSSHPYEINEIRRHLSLIYPDCLAQHMHVFSENFKRRLQLGLGHVSLHIPKTGGTSLCKSAKHTANFTTEGSNCWTGNFCPVWCCCEEPKTMTCDALSRIKTNFVMNENWLDDLCDDRIYSVLVRDPIGRAVSHVNHLLELVARHGLKMFHNNTGWRLSLIQANYMTWSLTAALDTSNHHPRYFIPSEEHMHIAKTRLERMDFVIDLSYPDKDCNNIILELIGISSSVSKSNAHGNNYKRNFRQADYKLLNELDIELYAHANKIIEADCIFFKNYITN